MAMCNRVLFSLKKTNFKIKKDFFQKAPLAGIKVKSSINCDSGCSAIYRIVLDTSVAESIEFLSKSEFIDSESQRGVSTEPKVIVPVSYTHLRAHET